MAMAHWGPMIHLEIVIFNDQKYQITRGYPLVIYTIATWTWPLIVDFPIKNGDFQ